MTRPEEGLLRSLRALPRPVWWLFAGSFVNRFGSFVSVFLVLYLALAMIWAVLQASGVIDSLEQLLGQVFPSGSGISPTGEVSTGGAPPLQIDTGEVFTWLFLAGCVGVVIWSLINVFLAVMYNLISDIVGGVEVTLADRRDSE